MVFTGESNRIPVEKKYFKRKSHGAAFIIEAITFVKENRFNSIIEKDGSWGFVIFFYCPHIPIRLHDKKSADE